MEKIFRSILVTVFGIATTLATTAALVYLDLRANFGIYTYLYGFIPIGAMFAGTVAASGYYFGSRWMSYRPGRWFFVNILAVSCANFFLIEWVEYWLLESDGVLVRTFMPFPAYLAYTFTHTSLTTNFTGQSGDATQLGAFGYLYAAVLIVGFACGGSLIYLLTRARAYCEACSRYMKKQGSQNRYFPRREALDACWNGMKEESNRKQFRKAVQLHADSGTREIDEGSGYSLEVKFWHCKICGNQRMVLLAKQRVNKKWNLISNLHYSAYCTERIDVIENMVAAD